MGSEKKIDGTSMIVGNQLKFQLISELFIADVWTQFSYSPHSKIAIYSLQKQLFSPDPLAALTELCAALATSTAVSSSPVFTRNRDAIDRFDEFLPKSRHKINSLKTRMMPEKSNEPNGILSASDQQQLYSRLATNLGACLSLDCFD